MEKPKTIWALIFLWIFVLFLFILHIWHYYSVIFFYGLQNVNEIEYYALFFLTNATIIVIIVIIDSIYAARKWSWLLSVLFSFFLLVRYTQLSLHSVNVVFFTNNLSSENSPVYYLVWHAANLIFPFVMFFIFMLLFKPSVKTYFNQKIPGDQLK